MTKKSKHDGFHLFTPSSNSTNRVVVFHTSAKKCLKGFIVIEVTSLLIRNLIFRRDLTYFQFDGIIETKINPGSLVENNVISNIE